MPDEKEEKQELTPKEKRFCEAYVRLGKKQAAAIEAGYSPKSAAVIANRLLKKDKILSHTHAIQNSHARELCISKDWLVLKIIEIYEQCTEKTPIMKWDYEQHKMVESGQYKYDAKNALDALDKIGKLLGLGENTEQLNAAITIINNIEEKDE